MLQVEFRLRPSWEVAKLTERSPSVSIYDWCNFSIDFYQIRSSVRRDLEAATRGLLDYNRKQGFVLEKRTEVGKDAAALVMKCRHALHGSVEETMNRFGCFAFYPFVFERGWAKVTGVALEDGQVTAMLSELGRFGEVQVEARTKADPGMLKDNFVIPTVVVASGLTAKQAESLLVAVDYGYYSVPRKTKFEVIASRMKTPRTTYEEHVRKAESKVIRAVAPYLSIYFGRGERVETERAP